MINAPVLALTALIAALVAATAADAASQAVRRCVVVDPTRGALTVRATPSGGDAGRLRTGARVEMLDIAYDDKDRPWARVRSVDSGAREISGWVFRAFLECD
ncbi:SH3 domain-containing protein [Breoghania sp. L-A4]|uniref:SH3 domain-containing protein n=1 Tax=Breoghania sp. L-A4 TaxID=2304600 RepID=UPI000E359A61|nr:SH3 domain-containing protein [Breoghania sp. L-A4]AXS39008.1 SH3 domain-containing protein [Breoghania sp. L-A4]